MTQAAFAADWITAWFGIVRTAHTLHLNLKVCVARSGRECGVATHAAGMDAGYGLLGFVGRAFMPDLLLLTQYI